MPGRIFYFKYPSIGAGLIKVILLALLWSSGLLAKGQSSKLDSLMAIWQDETRPDTIRLMAVDWIIRRRYMGRVADSALLFVGQQYEFALEKGNKRWQSKALDTKARILVRSGTYREALECHRENLELQKEQQDIKGLASTYKKMGYIFRKQGHYGEALEYYQESLNWAEQLGEKGKPWRAATLNSMGSLYLDQNDQDNALKHYEQSLALHLELEKKKGISSNYNNLSLVYQNWDEYDKALDYLNRSLAIKLELRDQEGIANVYQNVGNINYDLGRFVEAKVYYEKSYRLRDSFELKDDLAESCSRLGLVALEFGQYQKAARWCSKGRVLSQSMGNIEEEASNCECLYQAFKNMGDKVQALAYHEQLLMLKDSLLNEETTRRLARLEMQYQHEREKAAAEIAQARERAIMETQLQQQSTLRNIFIAVALVFALLSYLTFRVNQARRRKNIELNRKNQQIEKDRQTIASQAKELRELDEMKSRFFTNISHELRTPITLITAPAEQLIRQEGDSLSSNANKYLQYILKNSRRLLVLVEELLTLSRLDSNNIQLQVQPTSLTIFCRQLFSTFLSKAEINQIEYIFHCELDEGDLFLVDQNRLEKIVANLLSNALKFTPRGGRVSLSVTSAALPGGQKEPVSYSPSVLYRKLAISVTDTGRGIPPEDLPYVFDRYFQTKRKSMAIEGGTGIGLALSRELAHLMKGELSVQSEWEKGSTFTLSFTAQMAEALPEEVPIQAGLTTPLPTSTALPSPLSFKRGTILIVEDHPDMQQLIRSLLEQNYDCLLANNGAEAWALLQQRQLNLDNLDLIISDIMMPEMDGYALLNRIKNDDTWRQIPMIMLTARSAENDKLQALRMGVDDYLIKPFSPEELLVRSANLIQNHRERRAYHASSPQPIEASFEVGASAAQDWLRQLEEAALDAIEKKIGLNRSYLANSIALSERQLLRRLKALTGLSIKQYIQEIKLQKARILLENQACQTIAEVAYASGFNTPGYFTKVYKKHFGKMPSAYFIPLSD